MNIRDTRSLKALASQRLNQAPEQKRIVLIYAGITLAVSALSTVITYCLDVQISQAVGLSRIGSRSMLSTLQTILPIVQMLFLMCLDLGYKSAMLRVARGQYSSPNSLRLGFDRFWPLLRCTLLQSLIYIAVCLGVLYLGILIYLVTPLGNSVTEIMLPLITETAESGQTAVVLDDATYLRMVTAMLPCLLLCGILIGVILTPVFYQFRMAEYVIIDRPACGARAALRESRNMMKGNRFRLFRLDLSLWWYYAALAVASLVCYCDQILPMLGIVLPWSATVSYFVSYGLYLAMDFAILYFLRNRTEVTYALAYEAVKPEEKHDGGVVLGNIFQM